MAHLIDLRAIGSRIFRNREGLRRLPWSRRRFSRSAGDSPPAQPEINVPSTEIVTPLPPLTQPMPGLPQPVYATISDENITAKVTTLSNGLRVASEKRFGHFCTVGVVIESGCRHELEYPGGLSHFYEKLAFGATQHYPNKDNLLKQLEQHGGICDSQASRDTMVYATSADSRGLPSIIKILGEVILRPLLAAEEVEAARQSIRFELEALHTRPEQEPLLMDMIHAAAFRDNTLGLPKICPRDTLETIDRRTLMSYLKNHYTPERMVVAGVGVEHEALVEQVQKYFVEGGCSWDGETGLERKTPDKSIAQYTGGIELEECEIPLYPGSDLPELSHVVLGLQGVSHQDEDFVAMCVLNMMMGGGGSFSAGGPGKGMYTRLYTNVLNRHHWMFNATAYNHSYLDAGIFCVHASAPPARLGDTLDILLRELSHMASQCSDQELKRARTQIQSMLLMNLEARPVVFEDIARQVLATGIKRQPQYFIDAIDHIMPSDIVRVARRLLNSQPCIAARGKLEKLPPYKQIQENLISPKPSRLSLFS